MIDMISVFAPIQGKIKSASDKSWHFCLSAEIYLTLLDKGSGEVLGFLDFHGITDAPAHHSH